MSLIVDDGNGHADIESYASSAEADAYRLTCCRFGRHRPKLVGQDPRTRQG